MYLGFFHVHKHATVPDDFGRLRPFGSHCATVLCLPGLLVLVWTNIVCLPDCLAMRLVLQSTAVGTDGPQCFAASATY